MRMTVAQLIVNLRSMPLEARVVVASDEEGNSYGDPGMFTPETGTDGKPVVTLFPLGYMQEEEVFK